MLLMRGNQINSSLVVHLLGLFTQDELLFELFKSVESILKLQHLAEHAFKGHAGHNFII